MSARDLYLRRFKHTGYNGNTDYTLGEKLKHNSDMVMESTWWNDPQSKIAYIYDYFHDDQPDINHGMTYDKNTTKYKVPIKLYITEHGSLSKDQPSASIMFMPSFNKYSFDEQHPLYYYKERFIDRYSAEFPIGLYIDIPNEDGIYYKWLIVLADIQDSKFVKFFILPCTYRLMWVEKSNGKRLKRKMWGVLRSQSSYNSGLWSD